MGVVRCEGGVQGTHTLLAHGLVSHSYLRVRALHILSYGAWVHGYTDAACGTAPAGLDAHAGGRRRVPKGLWRRCWQRATQLGLPRTGRGHAERAEAVPAVARSA